MATDRIQEFTLEGRNFVYFDLSGFRDIGEYKAVVELAAGIIAKHADGSLMTVTNVSNAWVNTDVQALMTRFMSANRPFVKCGAVICSDTAQMAMLKPIFLLSKRGNMACFYTREDAVQWLLKQS